ncbi:MAG TPA: peptidylprolyl isomerase [Vicinamibacterales bacterium]|nr:peptidylprolyl isomerase [Vicinamibacterales bacterium]
MKKLLSAALMVLLVGAVARAEIFEQILVKINGDIFTKSDLEQRQVAALRQKGQQFDLKTDAGNAQLKKTLEELTPQIVVDVVDETLLSQRGKELGYKLGDDQFKSIVESIKKENKIETDEQLQAALKSENMTMADLRRNLEKTMIIQRVQQNEVMGKIGVTDDEARRYYETHMNEFTTQPTITLREILVTVPSDSRGVNAAADEAAKTKAEDIRARAVAGKESFDKLASEVSDSPSKANGGLIGPFSLNEISPELRKTIDGMKPGDISPVMRDARRGYQILKLETKSETKVLPFDEARSQISEHVFTDKRKLEYQKYLEKLRAQAIIEWKNPDIKKAFDEGLKQQQAGLTQ